MSGKVRQEACAEVRGYSDTYNVPSEVDVWEFLVDVLDGGLHALFCEEGKSCLGVGTGLRQKKDKDDDISLHRGFVISHCSR